MKNPNTLITRFYGLYSIKPLDSNEKNVRFVIMNNVFDTELEIHEKYDLKGSTVGRSSQKDVVEIDLKKKKNIILKDLDIKENKKKIKIEKKLKEQLLTQLKSDCEWLQTMNIMDYSLLLGILFVK
jgi:1-phosphatidylinositol-4-phosphate 5-kinase